MRSILQVYLRRLAELRHVLREYTVEEHLLQVAAGSLRSVAARRALRLYQRLDSRMPSHRKLQLHRTVIVGMYGAWEQYVENLVCAYATLWSTWTPVYADLCGEMQQFHSKLSYQLIGKLDQPRYSSLSETEIVANLHSCMSGATKYKLNVEAFAIRSSNMRMNVVAELFNRLGCVSIMQSVRMMPEFIAIQRPLLGPNLAMLSNDHVFARLRDMVDMRNDVAHGVVSHVLSHGMLRDEVRFMEVLGKCLCSAVINRIVQAQLMTYGVPIGRPRAVFRKRIVGFDLSRRKIRVGDILVATRDNGKLVVQSSVVKRIQIGKHVVEQVPGIKRVTVTMELDSRAYQGASYFILPSRFSP